MVLLIVAETKVAQIQRSCGYALRPTLTIAEIERATQLIKAQNPDVSSCWVYPPCAFAPLTVLLQLLFLLLFPYLNTQGPDAQGPQPGVSAPAAAALVLEIAWHDMGTRPWLARLARAAPAVQLHPCVSTVSIRVGNCRACCARRMAASLGGGAEAACTGSFWVRPSAYNCTVSEPGRLIQLHGLGCCRLLLWWTTATGSSLICASRRR